MFSRPERAEVFDSESDLYERDALRRRCLCGCYLVHRSCVCLVAVSHVHRDASGEREEQCVTALMYPNAEWDSSWSGETVFFNEADLVKLAVMPKPGRLVLFVSSMKHVGRPPSRLFFGQRFTMAVKFVPSA